MKLVQFGVNTTPEIRLRHLWWELYRDFCRDSLDVQMIEFLGILVEPGPGD